MYQLFTYSALSIFGLWFINRFVFSWLGLILQLVGIIHYKSIVDVSTESRGTRLSEYVELRALASIVRNPNYKVLDRGHNVLITREWGEVRYQFFLTNLEDRSINKNLTGYIKINTQRNKSIHHGERPWVPSYLLRLRAYRVVRDLPLPKRLKREIKANLRVRWNSSISFGWI